MRIPKIGNISSAEEVCSTMMTVELALWFNPTKNKNSVVRKTVNRIKHRMSPDIKLILHSWSRSHEPFEAYSKFMDKAGL